MRVKIPFMAIAATARHFLALMATTSTTNLWNLIRCDTKISQRASLRRFHSFGAIRASGAMCKWRSRTIVKFAHSRLFFVSHMRDVRRWRVVLSTVADPRARPLKVNSKINTYTFVRKHRTLRSLRECKEYCRRWKENKYKKKQQNSQRVHAYRYHHWFATYSSELCLNTWKYDSLTRSYTFCLLFGFRSYEFLLALSRL